MEAPNKLRNPIRLNKTELEGLEPGSKDYFNPVEGYQGLHVRVLPDGEKAFVLRYRFQGIQKKIALGRYPAMTPDAAKKAHTAAWALINAGTDPGQAKADKRAEAAEKRRAAVTVSDLVDRYQTEHTPTNSAVWQKESKRLMNRHIIPALGNLPLAQVGPAEISALLYKVGKATPVQANRLRAVLRTMFGRAEEWGLRPLGSNPVAVIKRRTSEVKRERRLTDLELKALGVVLRNFNKSPTTLLAIRLVLLAGMRKGEIEGLMWSWVDLEAGEIRIPPKAHKTGKKTGKVRVVHLCSALIAEMKAVVHTLGCPYVVPARPREGEDGKITWPEVSLQFPWVQIRDAAGLAPRSEEGEYVDEENIPGLHDLRRTFASVGADLGLKGFVGELLGHAEQTVTDIYTRTAAARLQEAAEAIGARIDGILSGTIDPEKEAEAQRQAKKGKEA